MKKAGTARNPARTGESYSLEYMSMTWPAAFHPNGQTARPLGTPAPITVNADGLFVGIHIDDLAGSVGKGLKVELRDNEIFLFGGKAQLGRHHRVQQYVELIRVVDIFQKHLDGRRKAHKLVADLQRRAAGRYGEAVRNGHNVGPVVTGIEGVHAGSHRILAESRGGSYLGQRQAGSGIADAPILNELRGVGHRGRAGSYGFDFVKSHLCHAGGKRLTEEKVIEHFAVDGCKLGFAGDLAFAPSHSLRKLLLSVKLLDVARDIERYVLQRSEFHGSGIRGGIAARGKAPQGA